MYLQICYLLALTVKGLLVKTRNIFYFGLVTSSLMMKVTVAGLIHSRAWIPPSIKIAGFGEPKIYITYIYAIDPE